MYGGTKNEDAAWEFFKFIEGPEAQLAHARSGATFPSRKSIQLHPEVAVPGRAPEHFKLFVDGQRFVRLDPQVSNWRDIEAAIDAELGPLWEGQRSAREAAMAVKRVVDPMLKEAAAREAARPVGAGRPGGDRATGGVQPEHHRRRPPTVTAVTFC